MIHTDQLTRHFVSRKETVEAVRGVDIDVAAGELVAFLGPNGAGKSTTLRMLTTLLPPTSGRAQVAGADIVAEPAAVRARIGYIGQGSGGGHSFRVIDELVSQGRFYGLNSADAHARAAELISSLDLGGMEKRQIVSLSGGQRRRLDVALGLMNSPRLLFLDEPSTGMDPHNRANLWEHIRKLRAELGTTIVLTTHYLEEADAEAERVIVIDHGKIIADDTAPHLKATLAGDLVTVVVDLADADRAVVVLGERGSGVERSERGTGARSERGTGARHERGTEVAVTARFDHGRQALPLLLRSLEADGVFAHAADVKLPTLDDVFLSLTGRSLREESEVAV